MKKRYWIYGILVIFFLCMMSGCKKKDSTQKDTEVRKESEKTSAEEKKAEEASAEESGAAAESEYAKEVGTGQDSEQTPEQIALEELGRQIQELLQQIEVNGAAASVYVENLATETGTSVYSQQMQAASLIKLYIAGCVYEQMEEMKVQESCEGETEELIRIMISASDNDAANTLTVRLGHGDAASGRAAVNQFCQAHEYMDTHMGRMMLEFTSEDDCGRFLKDIYQQKLAGSENILTYMKQQERRNKLPAGVPENIMTANKTGELTDVENDVAVVYTENLDYIICVMMSGLQNPGTGQNLITELSSIVYQNMTTREKRT